MTSPRLETVAELEVSPELQLVVAAQLDDYLAIQAAIKDLEAQADAIKTEVLATFSDAGELAALDAGVNVEGHGKVKMVYATSAPKLDAKKLIAAGVTKAQIERGTLPGKPNTPYVKLSPASKKRETGE